MGFMNLHDPMPITEECIPAHLRTVIDLQPDLPIMMSRGDIATLYDGVRDALVAINADGLPPWPARIDLPHPNTTPPCRSLPVPIHSLARLVLGDSDLDLVVEADGALHTHDDTPAPRIDPSPGKGIAHAIMRNLPLTASSNEFIRADGPPLVRLRFPRPSAHELARLQIRRVPGGRSCRT